MRTPKRFLSLNPVVGCTIGCPYCYARSINGKRPQIDNWNRPQFFPDRLSALYKRRAPSVFFLTTMNDPSDWEPHWAEAVMKAVRENPRHLYLFLTKRPARLPLIGETPNIWLGCTVTRKEEVSRLDDLRRIPAHRRFVSFEPLHGPMPPLNLEGLNWAWIGGETGFRPEKVDCLPDWVEGLAAQCSGAGLPFHIHHGFKGGPKSATYPEEFFTGEPGLFDDR